MEEKEEKKEEKNKIWKIILKIILILSIIFIILVVAIIGLGIVYIRNKTDKIQRMEINQNEIGLNQEVEENLEGYRNIALFGIDSRRIDSYTKGNRSDCIIIASLNNKTKEVKLISVYRDTYLKIDGIGLDKATHAYSYGTEELALKMLNTNLDLNIKEFVTVNFDAVVEAVDDLGGVEINVENEAERKALNNNIGETAKVTHKSNKPVTRIGKQMLNGVQAVAYARVRYTSGGDYKRTERMRNVIIAMAEKLKTKSIGEINTFIDKVLPKIHTNIQTNEMISLIPSALKINIVESIGWPYNTRGKTMNAWYGIPITLENNVVRLHKELFDEENYEPTKQVKEISNSIINKTGYTQ